MALVLNFQQGRCTSFFVRMLALFGSSVPVQTAFYHTLSFPQESPPFPSPTLKNEEPLFYTKKSGNSPSLGAFPDFLLLLFILIQYISQTCPALFYIAYNTDATLIIYFHLLSGLLPEDRNSSRLNSSAISTPY